MVSIGFAIDEHEVEGVQDAQPRRASVFPRQLSSREKLHQRSRFTRRSPKARSFGGAHRRRDKRYGL